MWLKGEKNKKRQIAYSLILGGALGNLLDRFMYGAVVDFIDFHVNLYHWPTFNLADSFICIGAFIYLLSFTNKKKGKNVKQ
jgi:signal peptidase II